MKRQMSKMVHEGDFRPPPPNKVSFWVCRPSKVALMPGNAVISSTKHSYDVSGLFWCVWMVVGANEMDYSHILVMVTHVNFDPSWPLTSHALLAWYVVANTSKHLGIIVTMLSHAFHNVLGCFRSFKALSQPKGEKISKMMGQNHIETFLSLGPKNYFAPRRTHFKHRIRTDLVESCKNMGLLTP